jgi:hypothetical protein
VAVLWQHHWLPPSWLACLHRVIRVGIELTTIDGTIGEVGSLLGYPNDEGVEREK